MLAGLAGEQGPRHLDGDFELVRDTFRRFAEDRDPPGAEHVHRTNSDVPEDIIAGLAEMGGFGLSVPEAYGGFATGGESDYLGMVVATEELSRGSLGVGGSLITRPEILTRALIRGGTEDQKRDWLPRSPPPRSMAAVAVTEPDFGSDVAGLKVTATRADGGWLINGVKTWCTFAARADVLMLLARTDPDRSPGPPRPLACSSSQSPRATATASCSTRRALPGRGPGGWRAGRSTPSATGACIPTRSPSTAGGCPTTTWSAAPAGQGRGFYYQMEGFENGRLQTAATGGRRHAGGLRGGPRLRRRTAGSSARPSSTTSSPRPSWPAWPCSSRPAASSSYQVARLMAKGEGALEASMVKAYVCRAAEWVTREAMQIHGGMGYAEEFPVSRYFVDARVLSIFEGADETLALKVIARRLVEQAAG